MKKWGKLFVILFAASLLFFVPPANTKAGSPQTPIDDQYNSYMLSDAEFIAHDSMTEQEIQTFLEQHVTNGACDTWRVNPYGDDPTPPWTCLYQYRDPANGKLASKIIKEAAEDYWVSPKVILVTLQKENSLVTDNWPWPSQYRTAMGMGCPETDVCGGVFYGFTNQVRRGTSLLKAVFNKSCEPGGNLFGFTYFNTFANSYRTLDGKSTYVGNCATAAFFQYTPHRPDSAWNLVPIWNNTLQKFVMDYAYGNYNFVTKYNEWFGQVAYIQKNIRLSSSLSLSNYNAAIGENVNDSFTIKNYLATPITLDKVLITGRDPLGNPVDYPIHSMVTLSASGTSGDSATFSDSRSFSSLGVHAVWVSVYYQGTWISLSPDAGKTNYMTFNVHKPNLTVTGFTFNPGTPTVGQEVTVNYTVKNNEAKDVKVDVLSVGNHLYSMSGPNRDYGGYTDITIPAGQTVTLSVKRTLTEPGLYVAVVVARTGNYWTELKWGNGVSSMSFYNVSPFGDGIKAVVPLTVTDTNPAIGTNIDATFRIRNKISTPIKIDRIVVTGRSVNWAPKDFPVQYDVTLAAFGDSSGNDFYTPPTLTASIPDLNTYKFWISYLYNGTWYDVKPDTTQAVSTNVTTRVPNLTVTGFTFNPGTPTVGQEVTVNYTVKNNEAKDVKVDVLSVGNHLYSMSGPNRDYGGYTDIIIPAGQTVTLSVKRTLTEPGLYVAVVVVRTGNYWTELKWGNGVSSMSFYNVK